jgi:diguanylate cyclase (GGDEF)-like protein/PAS domain S-box-containing protein
MTPCYSEKPLTSLPLTKTNEIREDSATNNMGIDPDKSGPISRWIALLLLACIGLLALVSADRSARLAQQHQHKSRQDKITRLVQSRLNRAIQIPLNSVTSMQAFMLARPTFPSNRSFDKFAATMRAHTPAVDGFAFVDAQRVIRHFYPSAGNEKAIGLDLMTRPAAPYVEKAIRARRMTMSPPTVTVQGHLSTIARAPLYRDGKFLGLVQGVIDVNKTLALVTEDLDSNVHVYLEDGDGRHFWGPSKFPEQAAEIHINVGDGQWLAKIWSDAIPGSANHMVPLIWLGGGALLLSLLFIVNRNFTEGQRLSSAVHAKTAQLAASESRWRSLLEQVQLLGIGLDRNGRVSYVNPFFCKVTGFVSSEVIGKDWIRNFLPKGIQDQLLDLFGTVQQGGTVDQYLNPILTKSNDQLVVSWFNVRVVDEQGQFDGILSIGEDITLRQELEKRLDYLAYHDTLTGLPNRTLFLDRLEHAVQRAQRDNTLLALLIIDLDQFKNVNDSLGHFAGDMLLQAASQRFHDATRSADTVARLGGDEFAVLLENIQHIDMVKAVADKILNAFSAPFEIENNKLYVSASVGIVMYPMADDEIKDLLRAADTAMYHAKASGRNCYHFYEASMTTMAHSRLILANQLRDALQQEAFSLAFQPVVELSGERITGFEALLRWQHPELGWVSPGEFIPVAESTGIIEQIGYWVLRHACRSYDCLQATANPDIFLSVNLSGHQFRDKGFSAVFQQILTEEGMSPQNLVVEITESQLMEDTQMALQVLHTLRDAGCRIAIDDFGTGYSSLSYLRLFPVDILKIDRSFVADLANDENSVALLKAIRMIAESLQIEVIAEGLETAEQLATIQALGIHRAQGYHLGRPQPLTSMQKAQDPN